MKTQSKHTPKLSLETHGGLNSVVYHDGHGNRTVLISIDDPVPGRYEEFAREAKELAGHDLVAHFQSCVDALCVGRHDHWKSTLLASLIKQAASAPDLLRQRDELREALKECITHSNAHCLTTENREVAMFKRLEAINHSARAAIAHAEKGVQS